MDSDVTETRNIYEQLWNNAIQTFGAEGPRIDPLLQNKNRDSRRGITLVARPGAEVQKAVKKFLHEAAAICPRQHLYDSGELHLTVLAVFSGTETWRKEIRFLPSYRRILNETLKKQQSFSVIFRGVTVSPDGVMIQGFPTDQTLAGIREDLRVAFRKGGFGEKLDRRYKIATAHLTAMRFSTGGEDWKKLLDFLQTNREREFGETCFQSLQLIWSNWYASAETVRILQDYPLAG